MKRDLKWIPLAIAVAMMSVAAFAGGLGGGGLSNQPTAVSQINGKAITPSSVVSSGAVTGSTIGCTSNCIVKSGGSSAIQMTDSSGAITPGGAGGWFFVQQAGTGTGTGNAHGTLSVITTPVNSVNGAETDLQSYVLPANSLITTGRCVRYEYSGTTANNVNAKSIKVYFGASVQTVTVPISVASDWQGKTTVCRTGASAQRFTSLVIITNTATNAVSASYALDGTAAATETATIAVKITGTGVTTNDITGNMMVTDYL